MPISKSRGVRVVELEKCPTGIRGLDDITRGGLPRGRPTLICGGAGSGKTLLAMEFLVQGVREFGEPGVFMSFEETTEELEKNVAALGFDLERLVRGKKLSMDFVHVERSEIEETGEYDLEGLFVRLDSAIKQVRAKRVVIDGLETLFAGLSNEGILRAELRRLFRWLKQKGVTAVITGEQGLNSLTRHGLEEYVSDCVIFLDHRVINQIATRRLRILKYRGSSHGTSEYPTMIDDRGLSVLPISSVDLNYSVSKERVSTGVERLDAMLGGKGYFRGSSVLLSGTAGCGKSSLAAAFVDRACARGERCLFIAFEESPDQVIRNMASIGIDLAKWIRRGLLKFHATRSTLCGLEQHLGVIHNLVDDFRPAIVVMDPVTNLTSIGGGDEVHAMLTRMLDFFKSRKITALFTSLTGGGRPLEQSEASVASLIDTWLLVQMVESSAERNRMLYVLKSRGMAHSNQAREIIISDRGIKLTDVYTGLGAVFTGTARLQQAARDQAEGAAQRLAALKRQRESGHEGLTLEAQIRALESRLSHLRQEGDSLAASDKIALDAADRTRGELARARRAD